MDYTDYCLYVQSNYSPIHPEVYRLDDDVVLPALLEAVRRPTPAGFRQVAEQLHPGVYAFDMFEPDFCQILLAVIANYEDWRAEHALVALRPNTMNRYGTILDTFGFTPFLAQLMRRFVAPFASLFYSEVGGDSLDSHHGFVVEYEVGKDEKLDFHVDASEVTLNVCLGKEFTGGTLYFRGVRCEVHQETMPLPGEDYAITHRPGRAVLHRGRHRHGANPIASGARHNLILWCKSSRFQASFDERACPSWCGYHGVEA